MNQQAKLAAEIYGRYWPSVPDKIVKDESIDNEEWQRQEMLKLSLEAASYLLENADPKFETEPIPLPEPKPEHEKTWRDIHNEVMDSHLFPQPLDELHAKLFDLVEFAYKYCGQHPQWQLDYRRAYEQYQRRHQLSLIRDSYTSSTPTTQPSF